MRLSSRQHHTAIFLESDQAARRQRRSATPNGDTQEAIYELFERSPCRAWSEFGPDGALQKTTAFDGQLIRSCVMGYRPRASRQAANDAPRFLFLSPETALMSLHPYSLTELLGSEELSSVSQREVDGEQLIDFTITRAVSPSVAVGTTHDSDAGFSQYFRYQVTVNATRHYWPIRVNIEHSQSRDGPPTSKSETTTEGWINAGPLVYPKKLKSLTYLARPTTTGATNKNDHSVVSPKLEHVTTNESEILEIAVNTDLPNSVFAPAFPVGSIIGGHDGKNYEVIADGTEQLYVAKAKGLRGAVFGFHLLWIAIGSTWLLRRKVGH